MLAALWLTGHLKSPGAHTLLALTNGVGAMLNAGLLYVGLARMGIVQPGHVMRGLLAAHRDRERRHGGLAGLARRRSRVLAEHGHARARPAAERPDRRGHRRLLRRPVAARRAGRPVPAAAGAAVGLKPDLQPIGLIPAIRPYNATPSGERLGARATMELVRGLHNVDRAARGCVLTIGAFDGIHRGHQEMIRVLRTTAAAQRLPGGAAVLRADAARVFRQGLRRRRA